MWTKIKSWLKYGAEPRPEVPGPMAAPVSKMTPFGPLVKISPTQCPGCKGKLDCGVGKFGHQGGKSIEGDVGVCHHCGAVLEFLNGGLNLISNERWDGLPDGMKAAVMLVAGQSGPGKPLNADGGEPKWLKE